MTDKEQKRKDYLKSYYQAKKDKIKEQAKAYADANKDKVKEYQKEYQKEYSRERDSNYFTEYYQMNKDNYQKNNYYELNKDKKKEYQKEYYQKNKDKIILRNSKDIEQRMKTDPLFKLTRNVRSLIKTSFKTNGFKKLSRTHLILGCSFDEFKTYLESKFEPWMSWDNRGLYNGTANYGWDIDHIIPSSSGATEEEIIKLNHYTNLQPLCSYYNRHIKRDYYK